MQTMKNVTYESYKEFYKKCNSVVVANKSIFLPKKWKISEFEPSVNDLKTNTTIWSFPDRGSWATHRGNYRGNWSPYIPRCLILKYTEKGDLVLDPMVGSGTTLVECKLLERNAIGVDINPDAIIISRNRLDFEYNPNVNYQEPQIQTYIGDAMHLDLIESNSVDLVTLHPPYADIIVYTQDLTEKDMSQIHDIDEFAKTIQNVAAESFRVLKPGKVCAILVGDTRRKSHYVPLSTRVMQCFLESGFILKENIIKHQWNTSGYKFWNQKSNNFHLIAHEHLFVFKKPKDKNELQKCRESTKWW
ncbi:MAG: DNA methyltransferase [Methanolobus sp.]|jgi:DNA modification methylase|nr:DNA methyltransferase [Methanolobus sp.]